MFERLGGLGGKNKQAEPPTRLPGLTAIRSADELLKLNNRDKILVKFPDLMELSPSHYHSLCKTIINNFAEFVQQLPSTRNSYYSHKGGLLDHALERSATVLSLVRAYFLPKGAESDPLTKQQILWAYVVFSASMLHDVGKVVDELRVDITDNRGKILTHWFPVEGSMVSQGSHYKYEFDDVTTEKFNTRVTIMIAQQLMPTDGLNWISKNNQTLAVWLALLVDDLRGAETLGPILMRADANALTQYLETHRLLHERFLDEKDHEKHHLQEKLDAEELKAGLAFLKWLKKKLKTGELTINKADSKVIRVGEGLLVTKEAVKAFTKDPKNKKYTSESKVEKSFEKLKITKPAADGKPQKEFINTSNQKKLVGYVLKSLAMLLPDAIPPSIHLRVMPTLGQLVGKTAAAKITGHAKGESKLDHVDPPKESKGPDTPPPAPSSSTGR